MVLPLEHVLHQFHNHHFNSNAVNFIVLAMVLAGNKIDLKKDPTIDEKIAAFQEKYSFISYFETSAKSDINVTNLFYQACKHNLENPSVGLVKSAQKKLLNESQNIQHKSCW